MIQPGSLPLFDGDTRNEAIYYLPQGWDPVLDGDIDGERATATEIDNSKPLFGSIHACRRITRSVFLGSAPDAGAVGTAKHHRGLELERLLLGCAQPGQVIGHYKDGVRALVDRLQYLNSENNRYWFDTRPNLRREMEDRKRRFDLREDVYPFIKDKLRFANGVFGGTHVFTASSDVPDDWQLRLVVLPPEATFSKGAQSPAIDAATAILKKRGEQDRQKQNRLIFLAPDTDSISRLKDQVTSSLAWKSIVDDVKEGRLNLDGQTQAYTFDYNWNRKTRKNFGGFSETFNITYQTNKLYNWEMTPGVMKYFSYDSRLNMLNNGRGIFTYDLRGNMQQATQNSVVATYGYNAFNRRVRKTVGGVSTFFLHDERGNLAGEYSASNATIGEHIYLGNLPIGFVQSGQVMAVHTDYLGTPRAITNGSTLVWKWDLNDPFGGNTPSVQAVTYNQRFAGQYFDAETGLHHNRYRTYDPQLGRYLQADPIGMAGGKNPYNYVNQNPLNGVDPDGLLNFGRIVQDEDAVLTCSPIHFDPVAKKCNPAYSLWKKRFYVAVDNWKEGDGPPSQSPNKFIEVFKLMPGQNTPPNEDHTMDCHGLTFVKMARENSRVWINNEEVEKILSGDNYRLIPKSMARIGDVVIYRNQSSKAVVHSGTVSSIGTGGIVVHQKGGYDSVIGDFPIGPGPNTAWEPKNAYTEIWRKP